MHEQDVVSKILSYARRIAVVGVSPKAWRPSHGVARTLIERGYEVVGVNPHVESVLGRDSYDSLAEVPGSIDVVDVFRRTEFLEDIAHEAVARGARALWMQEGLRSPEARLIAEKAGLDVVEDRCLAVEVGRWHQSMVLPPKA